MNYMKQVAQMLGVEIGEIFYIKNRYYKYRLTEKSIEYYDGLNQQWSNCYYIILGLLNGDDEIIKKPILDDVERKYLSNVIKPFRKQVVSICKLDNINYECIVIKYHNISGYTGTVCFPSFEKGTMYKGMEAEKRYSLEELGL